MVADYLESFLLQDPVDIKLEWKAPDEQGIIDFMVRLSWTLPPLCFLQTQSRSRRIPCTHPNHSMARVRKQVGEKGFNKERIEAGIKRLKAAKGKGTQQRMESFFGAAVVKRKAVEPPKKGQAPCFSARTPLLLALDSLECV